MCFYYKTYANLALIWHQSHFKHIMNWVVIEGFHGSSINSRMLTQLSFFRWHLFLHISSWQNIFSNVVMLGGKANVHKKSSSTTVFNRWFCDSSYTNIFPLSTWNTSIFLSLCIPSIRVLKRTPPAWADLLYVIHRD